MDETCRLRHGDDVFNGPGELFRRGVVLDEERPGAEREGAVANERFREHGENDDAVLGRAAAFAHERVQDLEAVLAWEQHIEDDTIRLNGLGQLDALLAAVRFEDVELRRGAFELPPVGVPVHLVVVDEEHLDGLLVTHGAREPVKSILPVIVPHR